MFFSLSPLSLTSPPHSATLPEEHGGASLPLRPPGTRLCSVHRSGVELHIGALFLLQIQSQLRLFTASHMAPYLWPRPPSTSSRLPVNSQWTPSGFRVNSELDSELVLTWLVDGWLEEMRFFHFFFFPSSFSSGLEFFSVESVRGQPRQTVNTT